MIAAAITVISATPNPMTMGQLIELRSSDGSTSATVVGGLYGFGFIDFKEERATGKRDTQARRSLLDVASLAVGCRRPRHRTMAEAQQWVVDMDYGTFHRAWTDAARRYSNRSHP